MILHGSLQLLVYSMEKFLTVHIGLGAGPYKLVTSEYLSEVVGMWALDSYRG